MDGLFDLFPWFVMGLTAVCSALAHSEAPPSANQHRWERMLCLCLVQAGSVVQR